jgi:thioredoxin
MKLVLALLASAFLLGSLSAQEDPIQEPHPLHEIVSLNPDNLKMVFDSSKPAVIDAFAPWCGPCRMFAPIFEKVHEIHGDTVQFYTLNGDEQGPLMQYFKVRRFPTVIFIQNGKEVGRHEGYLTQKQLEQRLAQLTEE